MITTQKTLGLIFAGMHDETLPQMTGVRSMGSVPFGGRYRLIDFPLSCMVNSGISKIGIITKSRYQSLMDHIGSGKAWDLSRKQQGLYFLPPTDTADEKYAGRIASLDGIQQFLRNSKEDYVVMSDCHVVGNIDYKALVKAHIETRADITVAYKKMPLPENGAALTVDCDESGRVTAIAINPPASGDLAVGLGLFVARKDVLMRLVAVAMSRNETSFERDILQRQVNTLHIFGYEVTEYVRMITSPASYFQANMELLDAGVRASLFLKKRPIFTKVHDSVPAVYGLDSHVTNSLVADGARIDGTVCNSIVFRGVHIEKGATVENCIVMQGTTISKDSKLGFVVIDKDGLVKSGRTLAGHETYPMYITKGAIV